MRTPGEQAAKYWGRRHGGLSILWVALVLLVPAPSLAAAPSPQVCFTPGGACTDLVVAEIGTAERQIFVQAYSFTSVPILSALKAAHARGIDVEVHFLSFCSDVAQGGPRRDPPPLLTARELGNGYHRRDSRGDIAIILQQHENLPSDDIQPKGWNWWSAALG